VLGVVEVDEQTFVAADIPGIIEGAHAGAGLGLRFLRHIERTRALLHVVDASGARDAVADLRVVRGELAAWNAELTARPQLVAANKRDALVGDDPLPALRAECEQLGLELVPISAATGAGLLELKRALLRLVRARRDAAAAEAAS
jgi:GTP-binding protein